MSQGNKLKFQRGAAANTEFEDRSKGAENCHHDRDGMAGPRKSPVFLSLVEIDTTNMFEFEVPTRTAAFTTMTFGIRFSVHRGVRAMSSLRTHAREAEMLTVLLARHHATFWIERRAVDDKIKRLKIRPGRWRRAQNRQRSYKISRPSIPGNRRAILFSSTALYVN